MSGVHVVTGDGGEGATGVLGDDLLLQPRHGRIRLGGQWIHFPLKPLDAILHLPKRFAFSLILVFLYGPRPVVNISSREALFLPTLATSL